MHKKSLRKDFLAQRQRISSNEIEKASLHIAQKLIYLINQNSPQYLLLYSAFGHEISLSPLLSVLDENKKIILGLPKIEGGRVMHFYIWSPHKNRLVKNKMGILEPDPLSDIIPSEDLINSDVWAITPALAVDKKGVRLGYGGGYYDTFFAKYPSIKKIAVMHHSFAVESLPSEQHDIMMDMLVTDREVLIY